MTDHDPETWMWERARAILEQADRMQRRAVRTRRPGTPHPSWEPPVDVFETATEIWILVALPGVELERIAIDVAGSALVVAGERTLPPAFRSAVVHRLEIPHGRFERHIDLPPGTYELGQKQAIDGCLFLSLHRLD